jgi:hypothetical protein
MNRMLHAMKLAAEKQEQQCLVHRHRYNQGTLARLRTEYMGTPKRQIVAQIDQFEGDRAIVSVTSYRTKIRRKKILKKRQA